MNCQELTQLLDDGDIRNIPPARRRELNDHLSGCPDCAAEWRVQERIAMTPSMWVPAGFVAQCRQLVAAGAVRLFAPRRLILYTTLMVLAAAAALVAWRYQASQVVADALVEAPVVAASVQVPPGIQPAPEPIPEPAGSQPVALPALPVTAQPVVTPRPKAFTVAVRPLQVEGNDVEGNALAARFRQRVIALLHEVPNLVIVDASSGPDPAVAEYELRMKYKEPPSPILRLMTLEVGKSAEFAANEAIIAAEARMSPEEQLQSRARRQMAAAQKRNAFLRSGDLNLAQLLRSDPPITAMLSSSLSARGGQTDVVESSAQRLVRDLRLTVFPPDDSFDQANLSVLRDPSQSYAYREAGLGGLLTSAERRGGYSRMSPAAVRAGGEFAMTAVAPIALERSAIWDALALTGSPELVPYLVRGLDEIALTETRLQLVKILADKYGDDPRAQAALAAAARSNDQETVRMAAMRETGDSGWHDYVVATLENSTLSDLQRLQPIADMAPGEMAAMSTSPKTKMALDAQQLRELGAILIRIAPDHGATEVAQKALFAAGAMETPAALDMLIEVFETLDMDGRKGLEGVSIMGVRDGARGLIAYRYAGEPRARALIEKLATSGTQMDRMILEGQPRIMDSKAAMDKARQDQSPVQ